MRVLGWLAIFLIAVLTLLLAAPAEAQTPQRMVGSTLIKFPVPAGQCEVNGRTKFEAAFYQIMRKAYEGTDTIFSIHTDCSLLERLNRQGGTLNEYSIYYMETRPAHALVSSAQLLDACNEFKPDQTIEIPKVIDGRSVSRPRFLGLIHYEKDTCYTAMLASVTAFGQTDEAVAILTFTLIKGKLLKYSLLRPFSGNKSILDALDRHKPNVAAFIAANAQ